MSVVLWLLAIAASIIWYIRQWAFYFISFFFGACISHNTTMQRHSYRPFLAMNCDGKLGRLLFVWLVVGGEWNWREEEARRERFMICFFFFWTVLISLLCVFGMFMGDKMHTRAHSPIHTHSTVSEPTKQQQQQQRKITTFTFCVARLPQWRLHYNLKFDQIRISHSDLLRHKWKCWKLIVDRVALQLAFILTQMWNCKKKISFHRWVFFSSSLSFVTTNAHAPKNIANPSQFFSVVVSKFYIYVCVCLCWSG